jgi:ABC-type Mn2+/Zn2+ transport system ATPase subunit
MTERAATDRGQHRDVALHVHTGGEPVVVMRGVTAGYTRGRPAVEGVDLEVDRGALLAILGPNGGGKSTLLKLAGGLLEPWSGTVEVFGEPPGAEAGRVAYVPQAELVDWSFPVSVWDVAMMGRYPRLRGLRQPGKRDQEIVAEALDRVAMLDRAKTQIGALSGGQRRRAFLARAIAAEADLFLLDEPVTGVDVTTQEELMLLLHAESHRGKTVIASTHDLAAVTRHFEQVVAVNRTVLATGPASIILDPDVLSRTYGGHVMILGDRRAVLIDDAHHHDAASGSEHHFHDEERGPR